MCTLTLAIFVMFREFCFKLLLGSYSDVSLLLLQDNSLLEEKEGEKGETEEGNIKVRKLIRPL